MSYFGGKGLSFRHIINEMPPHSVYLEPFVGGGSIFLKKKPAAFSLLADRSFSVCSSWRYQVHFLSVPAAIVNCDAISLLSSCSFPSDALVFCDPPYVHSTRKSSCRYEYELSDIDHIRLLDTLLSLNCYVLLSGYDSDLYASALPGWRKISYNTQTRSGSVSESLWCNFPKSAVLHDYSFLGSDKRVRARISKQQKNLFKKLEGLPPSECLAMVALFDAWRSSFSFPSPPSIFPRDPAPSFSASLDDVPFSSPASQTKGVS